MYEGKPVPGGTITFHIESSKGPKKATADLKEDGAFQIPKAAVGKAVVTVQTETANPGPQATGPAASRYRAIPTKYNSVKTSGISVNIEPGENSETIQLK